MALGSGSHALGVGIVSLLDSVEVSLQCNRLLRMKVVYVKQPHSKDPTTLFDVNE